MLSLRQPCHSQNSSLRHSSTSETVNSRVPLHFLFQNGLLFPDIHFLNGFEDFGPCHHVCADSGKAISLLTRMYHFVDDYSKQHIMYK